MFFPSFMNMHSLFMGLIPLIVYLLQSYAIYRLAVVRGIPNPLFAFIPFFQLFMLGQIGDSLKYRSDWVRDLLGRIPLTYALPLISIAGSLLRYPLSVLASLVVSLGMLVVYYLVYYHYAGKLCIPFTIFTCLPVLLSILTILSVIPFLGKLFEPIISVLMIASSLAPIIGPILILFCLKNYRNYR